MGIQYFIGIDRGRPCDFKKELESGCLQRQ